MTKIFLIIIIINICLLSTQLVLTSRLSSEGAEIAQLTSRQAALRESNSQLETQVFELGSLDHIKNQALSQNLFPIQSVYITPPAVAAAHIVP